MFRGIVKMFSDKEKIKKLREELGAPVISVFWGFVAVEEGVMEKRWGLPLVRQNGKDWYPLKGDEK